jgi:hypothetical protein
MKYKLKRIWQHKELKKYNQGKKITVKTVAYHYYFIYFLRGRSI